MILGGFLYCAQGAVLEEGFAADPLANGWSFFGQSNFFRWNPTAKNLEVTWDSSQPNSYFYHPLNTILARDDDFSVAFDLTLSDITTTTKPGPFEIVVGLVRLEDETRNDYWRGSGVDAAHGPRNVFEFDYFPAGYYPGYGDVAPSISPTLVSSNNFFAAGFDLMQLTNYQSYHIEMVYTASNATLRTSVSANGMAIGPLQDVTLGSDFTDFRLDTLAVCSYSDTGDDYDSVLAHGTLDNFVVQLPAPPVGNVEGFFSNNIWNVRFMTRTNWTYSLEVSTNLQDWATASESVPGTGGYATLQDTNAGRVCLYKVSATRP